MTRVRVLVADDHQVMLDHLVRLLSLEHEVVAAVRDGVAVVDAASRERPDLLVLDIAMPGLSGIAAASLVLANGLRAKVVFVTMHYDREFIDASLALGPVGFVFKDRLVMDLLPAVRAVLDGDTFVSPATARS